MSSGAKMAKNALWFMSATVLIKLVAFLTYAFVARWVGPTQLGVYFYAVSITSVFVILADIGMTPVVIRAIASKTSESRRLLSAVIRLKTVLAPIAVLVSLGYAVLANAPMETMATVAVATLVLTADTFSLVFYGAIRGMEKLSIESIGMFAGQTLTAAGSVGAAAAGLGPVGLVSGLLVGSLWNALWSYDQMRKSGIVLEKPRKEDYKQLAREAWPFGLAGISVKVYSYVDSLFLQAFHGAFSVGIYSVAYKMTYATQFLPLTFVAALYPALARAYAEGRKEDLATMYTNSLRLMAAISFPIAAGLSAMADRIIPLVYGNQYLASVGPFRILPWVLIPIFMDFPVGSLLNGTRRAHLKTISMVSTMLLNVILNAILVPLYGPTGAAYAGLASFWLLLIIGMYFTRHDAKGWTYSVWILVRAFVAGGLSWIVWYTVGRMMPFPAAFVFGGAVALLISMAFRLVTPDDLRWVLALRRIKGQDVGEKPHEDA